jgi:hypothetical protein
MQFSPRSVFLPFRPKYLPQHSVLCSQQTSPKVRDQVSHPYNTTGKITVLCILIFTLFVMRRTRSWNHRIINLQLWFASLYRLEGLNDNRRH